MSTFFSFIKSVFARKNKRKPKLSGAQRKAFRPAVEELEGRIVPTLVVDAANPRYFMDNTTGKIVYLAGSATWTDNQAVQGAAFNYTQFLSFLQSYNLDFFRMWSFGSSKTSLPTANYAMESVTPTIYVRSSTPGDNDGGNKFVIPDAPIVRPRDTRGSTHPLSASKVLTSSARWDSKPCCRLMADDAAGSCRK